MKNEKYLVAPQKYWSESALYTPSYINGCGGSGITASIIPDSLLGLDITNACNIHDYMYEKGIEKEISDKTFLSNMMTIINKDSDSKILKLLRKAKAYLYYFGVKLFGSFFYKKKKES